MMREIERQHPRPNLAEEEHRDPSDDQAVTTPMIGAASSHFWMSREQVSVRSSLTTQYICEAWDG
ncbi:MAG TPA: hypothetical protein VIX59_10560 [Candidatus Binataceae bacterium]